MFLRRVFSRKENSLSISNNKSSSLDQAYNEGESKKVPPSPHRLQRRRSSDDKRGLAVLQLTPLWEHIIRTKALPSNINHKEMFAEFLERLYDPEWQVRQHALRVLVDVLIVMGPSADQHFSPMVKPLVENLGHSAPAIRKGALDALKVYMTETAMPETVLLEIIDIGMEQKTSNDSVFGRICVGVMLSLPALIQTSLNSVKRNYIVKVAMEALTNKMVQVTYQEVALKVLLRIREMIGFREFSEHIAHGAYREFELLCNVYGLPRSPSRHSSAGNNDLYSAELNRAWQVLTPSASENSKVKPTELFWKSTTDDDDDDESDSLNKYLLKSKKSKNNDEKKNKNSDICLSNCSDNRENVKSSCDEDAEEEKVIMETEINIDNTPITMRILEERNSSHEILFDDSDDGDIGEELNNVYEHTGIVRVLTDSELEEINLNNYSDTEYVRRTPRRVTFGGEMVKMRTPDSDSVNQSEMDEKYSNHNESKKASTLLELPLSQHSLHVDILNDNTKPIRVTSAAVTKSEIINVSPDYDNTSTPTNSPKPKSRSVTPNSRRFRRLSVSPVDDIISPIPPHKQIEVFHNLQRSPVISPTRKRNSISENRLIEEPVEQNMMNDSSKELSSNKESKTWESLDLFSPEISQNLRSGDWRQRSDAICSIEDILKSTDNLAKIQPYLESLLRTLLSSEKNSDVSEDKRRVLINLISRLPLDNLENRTSQIIVGLCRLGGAGSNHVSKALMQRLPPTSVVHRLISDEFLKSRSSRFRENALQMVLYALMTFPSTYFDISICVGRATHAATDRKRRVRQASLDVLAVLGQISSIKTVMDIVQQIAQHREDGDRLVAAVKSRLSRKQLPIVSSDGNVQYALKIPLPESNSAAYLFGADVEWIIAGIGSVSPTSIKKRSQRMQMQSFNYDEINRNNITNSNNNSGTFEDSIKRQKPPHEILAVGVGVKPPYDSSNSSSNNNIGNSNGSTTKSSTNQHYSTATAMEDDKNTHFVISTAIPTTQIPVHLNVDAKQQQQTKLQIKSFPELSESTITYNKHSTKYIGNGSKPSRLPVTSRFPAMENNSDGKNGNIHYNHPNYNNTITYKSHHLGNKGLNRSLPKNLNTTNIPVRNGHTNYSQEILNNQNCNDEYRPASHPPFDSANLNQRRFVNVDKYLTDKFQEDNQDFIREKPEQNETTQTSQELMVNNNSSEIISRSSSAFINRSTGNISRQSNDQPFDNIEKNLNESSTEDHTTTSGSSTPTKFLERKNNFSNEQPNSRPLSVVSAATTKSLRDDEEIRPKTALSLVRSNASSATINNIKNKSETLSIENLLKISNETDANISRPQSSVHSNITDSKSEIEANVDSYSDSEADENIPAAENHSSEDADEEVDNSDVNEREEKVSVHENDVEKVELRVDTSKTPIEIDNESAGDAQNNNETEETDSDYVPQSQDEVDNINFQVIKSDIIDSPTSSTKSIVKRRPPLFGKKRVSPTKVPAIHQLYTKQKSIDLLEQSVRKFDKPKEAQNICLHQLESGNWEQTLAGLQSFVRLIRNHPDIVEPQIHAYCLALCKHIKNLRSQVSRAACQAAGEFYASHTKSLDQEADELSFSLLNRTADTNKFLRSDALKALESMCDNLPVTKAIQIIILRGASHQNAIVRAASAKLLNQIVDRVGCDRVFSMNRDLRDKLIITGANLLMEGSLETRNYAKLLFKQLSTHPSYSKTILEVIPTRTYRNIEKTLKSIS